MIHNETCALCGEDKQCVRVEHIGPVCVEDIHHMAQAEEHEEGAG